MDMTWITDRIAVGGGIWTDDKMQTVVREGVTHIIDMQIEFDDTEIAKPYGVVVLWNPVDDDFQPKPPSVFQRGVEFALAALNNNAGSKGRDPKSSPGTENSPGSDSANDAAQSAHRPKPGTARDSNDNSQTKLYIHCAAGVHRAPMMTLAVLRALGWSKPDAMRLITSQRPVADLAPVYVDSVERFMQSYDPAKK